MRGQLIETCAFWEPNGSLLGGADGSFLSLCVKWELAGTRMGEDASSRNGGGGFLGAVWLSDGSKLDVAREIQGDTNRRGRNE